jgi:ElaB/YqjD/DUF883 family membrane-anchored ribosome-binding protein
MNTNPQTTEDLLDELRALVSEIEKILDDPPNENGGVGIADLQERFNAARESLAGFCSGAQQKVKERARQTDAMIRENPYQSLAVAAAVGLLLGMLLNRRTD